MIVPAGVLSITVGADVHKNRIEVLWNGWGKREECWGLDHVIIHGEVQDDGVWTDFGRELTRPFDHALGCKIGLALGFVDGGKWGDWVFRFMRRLAGFVAFPNDPLPGMALRAYPYEGLALRGKIKACRGRGGPSPRAGRFPLVQTRYSPGLAGNLGGHWIGTDAAKDLIYTRARLQPPEDGKSFPDGFMHFPMSFDEEFMRQMFSERCTVKIENGQEIRTYQKKGSSVRNEAIDLEVYSLAAFKLMRYSNARFDAIEAELKKAAEELKRPSPDAGKPPPERQPRRRNNLVRSLKSGGGW